MTALLQVPDQRLILHGVSWDTYTRLCADCADSHAAHFTYDRGALEIMVLSFEHESQNRLLAALFEVVAEERDIDFENAGSTTFQREDLSRGFEADTAFYVENASAIRGKKQIMLGEDPPPDVVTEVDVSHSSLAKLPIFAAMRVPEVWHYNGEKATIWILKGDGYVASPVSSALPGLRAADIQEWMEKGQELKRIQWLKELRAWVRAAFPAT